MNLASYVAAQRQWSERTFGPADRNNGIIDHVRKELIEIEQAQTPEERLAEWVDVVILALDGCWRTGASPEDVERALHLKQTVNINREWPDWRAQPEGKAIEHVRVVPRYPE